MSSKTATSTKRRKNSRLFAWKGKRLTATEWAKETGIGRATILMRINKYGWSVAKALSTPAGTESARERLLTYEGRTQSLTAWAKEVNLSDRALYERLAKGMSIKEALTTPKSPGRKKNADKQ